MIERLLADFGSGLNQEHDPHYPGAGRIRRLYVLPEYRKTGLARRLIETIASQPASPM